MSLSKYNKKRDLRVTAKPDGKIGKTENELIFVVQKNAVSDRHRKLLRN